MNINRLADYLAHMQQAAREALDFTSGLAKDDFMKDRRTQQAVVMNLVVLGEAASKIMDGYREFIDAHPDLPWHAMRGMRNRIAHGYFDINLDVVWDTVQSALPELIKQLSGLESGRSRGQE